MTSNFFFFLMHFGFVQVFGELFTAALNGEDKFTYLCFAL